MGMDVYGRKPTTPEGEYFRNSVWWWHPLADYITSRFPEITSECNYWHSNDGDGLEAAAAIKLADAIEQDLADGTAAAYIAERNARIAALPRFPCEVCNGTGIRCDAIGKDMGMTEKPIPADAKREDNGSPDDTVPHPRAGQIGWCNGCNGVGTRTAFECIYLLDEANLKNFAAFCRASGGFNIN